jgi:microcystin-dependent protein
MKKNFIFLFLLLFAFALSLKEAKSQVVSWIGEIQLFPYNYVPINYMECSGQILNISENTALFSLLGTTYGGDGRTTFGLPDLRGKTPIHPGDIPGISVTLGSTGGTETEVMTTAQMPEHTHTSSMALKAPCYNDYGTSTVPGFYSVDSVRGNEFNTFSDTTSTAVNISVSSTGASEARNNMQPYTTMIWCICISGTFPSHP